MSDHKSIEKNEEKRCICICSQSQHPIVLRHNPMCPVHGLKRRNSEPWADKRLKDGR